MDLLSDRAERAYDVADGGKLATARLHASSSDPVALDALSPWGRTYKLLYKLALDNLELMLDNLVARPDKRLTESLEALQRLEAVENWLENTAATLVSWSLDIRLEAGALDTVSDPQILLGLVRALETIVTFSKQVYQALINGEEVLPLPEDLGKAIESLQGLTTTVQTCLALSAKKGPMQPINDYLTKFKTTIQSGSNQQRGMIPAVVLDTPEAGNDSKWPDPEASTFTVPQIMIQPPSQDSNRDSSSGSSPSDDIDTFAHPRGTWRAASPQNESLLRAKSGRDYTSDDTTYNIFPHEITCKLSITFNDSDATKAVHEYENFLWYDQRAYDKIQAMCEGFLEQIKRQDATEQDVYQSYLRYASLSITTNNGENPEPYSKIIDTSKLLRELAIQEICGFIRDHPRQKFGLLMHCDYSSFRIESHSRDLSLCDMMAIEYDKKLKTPRPTINRREYIPLADLKEVASFGMATRLVDDATEVPLADKEKLKEAISRYAANILVAVFVYSRVPLTYLSHLFFDPFHSPQESGSFKKCLENSCAEKSCLFYHQKINSNMHKFSAITIQKDHGFHELEAFDVIPVRYVIKNGDPQKLGQGVFTDVFEVDIDPAHCGQGISKSPLHTYALKVYNYFNQGSGTFKRELRILLSFTSYPHDHIQTHITSWEQGGQYHILYDKSDANLRQYIMTRRGGDLGRGRVLWFLSQLRGLADAIRQIHQLRAPEDALFRTSFLASGRKRQDTGIVGFHHDIKPENILLFDTQSQLPLMKVSDFGASKLSVSRHDLPNIPATSRARGTTTYLGPEFDHRMGVKMSRPLDMWALGCVFMELLLWFVDPKEPQERLDFSDLRAQDASKKTDFYASIDVFWSYQRSRHLGGPMAHFVLVPIVSKLLDDLSDRLCKNIPGLNAVVTLIRGLLRINPRERLTALDLHDRLDAILMQTEVDLSKDGDLYAKIFQQNLKAEPGDLDEELFRFLPPQYVVPHPMNDDASSYDLSEWKV